MTKLKVPSLQHLARNWHPDSAKITKDLVRLAENPPIFNYNPLFSAVTDMLLLGQPYDQIRKGIHKAVNREGVRNNYLEILPLLRGYVEGVNPDFVQKVDVRMYPVTRGFMIPFSPPLIYGVGGRVCFPWFSFWRASPLADERLSLFVTLVKEVLLDDPDLEDAKFEILDFSAPKPKAPRDLEIIDAKDVPILSNNDKQNMLSVFAEGFFKAQAELAAKGHPTTSEEQSDRSVDSDQHDLFDPGQ